MPVSTMIAVAWRAEDNGPPPWTVSVGRRRLGGPGPAPAIAATRPVPCGPLAGAAAPQVRSAPVLWIRPVAIV